MLGPGMPDLSSLLSRCTFPSAGTAVVCGLSGGADSTALVALALEAGCVVTAVHVHHGLRPSSHHDADVAAATAARLGAEFRVEHVELSNGPNLEARARAVRRGALGPGALTGHTADDQAETVLLALLRGSGATGLGAIEPGPQHPILGLRRSETEALCRLLELDVADDPTNTDPRFRRNRIRHEVLPLLDNVAERDVTVLLNRTATLLRDDDQLLDELATTLDPTFVEALIDAPRPLAVRAVRRWLEQDGYPPDAAGVARVLAVAHGDSAACELAGGLRIERRRDRLVLFPTRSDTR
jgi:tRNA(Ile)-lysidine synthase